MPPTALLSRRSVLAGAMAAPALALLGGRARADSPVLTIGSRQIEVLGRPATVYGMLGADGRPGIRAAAGARLQGAVVNATSGGVITHWHGQVFAAEGQDRAYTGGGALAAGASDLVDFMLTPGTHWMHSHQLTEQQLMAAPMITREADAPDMQEIVLMLHDFSFTSPEEILAGLGGSMAHGHGHGAGGTDGAEAMAGMDHSKMAAGGGGMAGMVHANDVAYDAYLANDRTLADPEVIAVDAGSTVRLRIINGGTATAFWINPGRLHSQVVAVDGSPCQPVSAPVYPMAQGQRLDLILTIPAEGGAFAVLAEVEAARMRTGIVLATPGAAVERIADLGEAEAGHLGTGFDAGLRAVTGLPDRPATATHHLMLGEEPGYRFTINGAVHGEAPPIAGRVGDRLELMFMNMGMMMHPMHLHGHHFQVVDVGQGRFNGPRRDVVAVPPGGMVTVAVDLDKPGSWFLHCHHLYHMATGMMTEVRVS